jgi:hypothetical protein
MCKMDLSRLYGSGHYNGTGDRERLELAVR